MLSLSLNSYFIKRFLEHKIVFFNGSCKKLIFVRQSNALACLQRRDLQMFTDIINEIDDSAKKFGGKLPSDHWINKSLDEEGGLTLLTVAIKSDLAEFVSVLLRAGADAQLVNPARGHLAPIHVAAQNLAVKSLQLLVLAHHPIKVSKFFSLKYCNDNQYFV